MMNNTIKHNALFLLSEAAFQINGQQLLYPSSVTIPGGEFNALIGHNGSGKSTLLRLFGKHLSPSTGSLIFQGRPVEQWGHAEFAREVAYLPQHLPAAQGMTVRELVSLGRYPWHGALGRFTQYDMQKVDEAIADTGLSRLSKRLVDSLSGGERQRAWIAMTLAQDTKCLLLDEPTSALDIAQQSEILCLLKKLCHLKEITIIAVLHDINMAARYCSNLLALKSGHLIALGSPAEIVTPASLNTIYGIQMGTFSHPVEGHPVCYVQ
ncbi:MULTISPECIES: ATP-binding cassette domain-containing protein [Enterobacteriaceae]|uniref:ATP-binding cassette domain-containing protein n=1 Tax=Enterobacteriaceae TaxID=543 RepID=UPI00350F0DB4